MARFHVRTKITIALLVLALVPLGVATGVLAFLNLDRLEHSTKRYSLSVADHAATEVSQLTNGAEAELTAAGLALGQPTIAIEQRIALVRSQLLSSQHVRQLSVYSPDGALIDTIRDASAGGGPEAPAALPPDLRPDAKNPLRRLPPRLTAGRADLPLLRAVVTGEPAAVWGYVWTAIDLSPLNGALAELSSRQLDRPDRVFLFDRSWRVVAHGKPEAVGRDLKGRGFLEGVDDPNAFLAKGVGYSSNYQADGIKLLGEVRPIPELSWGILVEQSKHLAFAGVRDTWQTALWLGVGFAVLAAFVGLGLGGRLSAPILQVAKAAKRVAAGSLDTRVDIGTNDEVEDLADAFNEMVSGLNEREFIRDTFGRYVTPELRDKVLSDPESLKLGGDSRLVTILMSDLRGFTSLSEQLGPERMVGLLNRYFSAMADVIVKHGGHLSEFVGDGLVVFFGAPTLADDDALRVVACALDMQIAVDAFSETEGRRLGMGIGVNTGVVIAGNIGSEQRMKYGVVGDAINLAARIESFTVGTQVLIAESTHALVKEHIEVGPMEKQSAKGKKHKVHYFPLLAVRGGGYDLALEVAPEEPRHAHVIAVKYQEMSGKNVSDDLEDAVTTSVWASGMLLDADHDPGRLSNLKLSFSAGGHELADVYAKVMDSQAGKGDRFNVEVQFTSVPEASQEPWRRFVEGLA